VVVGLFRQQRADFEPLFPQVDADKRVYAVGDIHGRADLLYRMVELVVDDVENATDARQAKCSPLS